MTKKDENFNYLDYEMEFADWKPLKWEKLNEALNGGVILAAEVTDYPIAPASGIIFYFKDRNGKIKALYIESENLDVICAYIANLPKEQRKKKILPLNYANTAL